MYLKGKSVLVLSSAVYHDPRGGVLNAHILSQELSSRGNKVLFVESVGLKNYSKLGKGDFKKIVKRLGLFFKSLILGPYIPQENLYVISPIRIPFFNNKTIDRINEFLISRYVRYFTKKYLDSNPIIWSFLPVYHYIKKTFPSSLFIYHIVDEYKSVPFVNKSYILQNEKKIIQKADIVFTVSIIKKDEILEDFEDKKVIYLNNVARFELFNKALQDSVQPPADILHIVKMKKPIIGYMGNIVNYKEDLDMLYRIAKYGQNYNFILIGTVGFGEINTNVDKLKSLDNVFFLGSRDYLKLYRYFKYFDVAIIPRRINKVSNGGFPLKYFEFLSAGVPTIITGIGSVSKFSRINEVGGIANTHKEFLNKIKYWTELKLNNFPEYDKCLNKRIKLAKENSWDKRMVEFEKILLPELNV